MILWRTRSKLVFSKRRKESKGEHLLDTRSKPWPIWRGRTASINASTRKVLLFLLTLTPHLTFWLLKRDWCFFATQSKTPAFPRAVKWQEALRRAMCFASDRTLCPTTRSTEGKHCSPPLSISEPKGIKGTSPALGSEANRQKQFSTQLKIKLHNALPLELQTSERCRVQKATRQFHRREIHPGLLKMKTSLMAKGQQAHRGPFSWALVARGSMMCLWSGTATLLFFSWPSQLIFWFFS